MLSIKVERLRHLFGTSLGKTVMFYLVALASHAGAASLPFEPAGEITLAIQAAGVRDPAAIVAALSQAALYSVADVAELNQAEAAELLEGLRAATIPLGDRARLRKTYENEGRHHTLANTLRHRHLQAGATHTTGGGGDGMSIEVAAIAFTGLIGMAGFIVQARSTQKASEAQASIEREAAERDKVEVKAAKQLERVQRQNKEFIYPAYVLTGHFMGGFDRAVFNCGCEGYIALQGQKWISPPTQPHVHFFQHHPEQSLRTQATPLAHTLPPEDLVHLAADPARCDQWQELVTHMMLPPLRKLIPIMQTLVHRGISCMPQAVID
jgi:hypothetical protein